MKKIFSFSCVLILMLNFSACSLFKGDEQKIEDPRDPFTFDYATDEQNLAYFTENDTFNLILASTPYYANPQTLDMPAFKEFEALRKAKVEEAITLTNELVSANKNLKTNMEPFKGAYIGLMETTIDEDKQYKKFAQESGGKLIENLVKEDGLIANIESIDENKIDNEYAKAMFEYQKTMMALQLTETTITDFADLFSNSVTAYELLSQSDNANIKEALSEFEKQMEKISDLNSSLDEISQKTAYLQVALKQIETGDYYFAKASLSFIDENLPAIKEMAATITPNEDLNQENIEAIQEYASILGAFSEELNAELDKTDTSALISVNLPQETNSSIFIGIANAEMGSSTTSSLASSTASLSAGTTEGASKMETAAKMIKQGASWTWSGVKDVYKKAQTGIGIGLDTASATTKSGFDVIFGAANGNSVSEIGQEISGNFKKVVDNYEKDISGAEVLKDANGFLESLEDATGNAIEGTIGKGWTSWGVGGIAKITVGMFTGFGKGVYKLANKQSTAGELAEGMLDVGLSFIGGSKTILQGVSGGSKEGLKVFGQKSINYLKMMANKIDRTQLKNITSEILKKAKLSPNDVLSLITNSLELEGKEIVAAELKAINQTINKKFTDLLKNGLAGILKNAKGAGATVAENYKNFTKEAFASSMTGMKEAMIKVLGEGYEDYIDNLITSKMDDMIKAAIKVYIDAGKYDGVYSANYPLGEGFSIPIKITIENGAITGNAEFNASKEGWTVNLKADFTGKVDEKGVASGEWTGNAKASGPSSSLSLFFSSGPSKTCTDNINLVGNGNINGTIVDNKLPLTLTGSATPSGTFFCEPINSGTQTMDAIKVQLIKEG